MSNQPSTSSAPSITSPSSSSSIVPSHPPSNSISESDITEKLLDFRRRFSSDATFFTDAAASFQPKPYNPNNPANFTRTGSSSSINSNRSRSSQDLTLTMHPAGMDPSPSDPNAFFIHPPFDVFPGAEDHPGGLTYLLIASQPEWFLDPNDFIYPGSTNPNAIPYPTKLEPPRGWCPARKRDLEKSGKDGWPTGEEPRLRCTFCRRTYAGVNAKSMWRRHVFEKHKIAMSNRRDGGDKSGRSGRSATKSSSQSTSPQPMTKPEDDAVSSQDGQESTSDQTDVAEEKEKAPAQTKRTKARTQPSRKKTSEVVQKDLPHPLAQSTLPPNSPPPPTPPPMEPTLSKDSFDAPPEGISPQELEAAQQLIAVASTPVPARFLAPQDPTSSPGYRYNESPLRRTNDQPWRYSPSDPRAKLMLTALNTSTSPGFHGVGTPESRERLKPSPRSLFGGSKSRLPISLADRLIDSPFNDSPLSRPIRQPGLFATPVGGSSSSSKNDPAWLFDGLSPWPKLNTDDMLRSPPMSGFNSSPLKGTGMTPFKDLLGLTGPVGPSVVDMSEESPVVRRTQVPIQTPLRKSSADEPGLGIGLMEPFSLVGTSKKKDKKQQQQQRTGSSIGGDSDVDVDAEFPPIKSDDEQDEDEDEGSTLVASTSSKGSSKSDLDRDGGHKHAREDDEGERPAKKIKLAIDD